MERTAIWGGIKCVVILHVKIIFPVVTNEWRNIIWARISGRKWIRGADVCCRRDGRIERGGKMRAGRDGE
jgi:hypothetical protein